MAVDLCITSFVYMFMFVSTTWTLFLTLNTFVVLFFLLILFVDRERKKSRFVMSVLTQARHTLWRSVEMVSDAARCPSANGLYG